MPIILMTRRGLKWKSGILNVDQSVAKTLVEPARSFTQRENVIVYAQLHRLLVRVEFVWFHFEARRIINLSAHWQESLRILTENHDRPHAAQYQSATRTEVELVLSDDDERHEPTKAASPPQSPSYVPGARNPGRSNVCCLSTPVLLGCSLRTIRAIF